MPRWIHDRARHIQAKNPSMDESAAFAIATQQAHKLKKTPKGYGTPEGRKKATQKYQAPKKSYTQGADPKGIGRNRTLSRSQLKQKEAMTTDPRFDLLMTQCFRDELVKIAEVSKEAGKVSDVAKAIGTAFKGSKLTRPKVVGETTIQPGLLGKLFGKKPKTVGGAVVNEKVPLFEALKDPNLRNEAFKTLGARGAAGTAAGVGAVEYSKAKKKSNQQRMGKAYVSGARDMYSRLHGY